MNRILGWAYSHGDQCQAGLISGLASHQYENIPHNWEAWAITVWKLRFQHKYGEVFNPSM